MVTQPKQNTKLLRLLRAATLLCAGLIIAGVTVLGARAAAIFDGVSETGTPGLLSLRSDPGEPQWKNFAPEDTALWQIEARLDDAERGEFSLELRADGSIVDEGLTVEVRSCGEPFEHSTCTATSDVVVPEARASEIATPTSGDVFALPDIHTDKLRYFLLTLHRPETAASVEQATARIGVGFHAAGEQRSSSPAPMPVTGTDLTGLGLLAAGLAGVGVLAIARRRAATRARMLTQGDNS